MDSYIYIDDLPFAPYWDMDNALQCKIETKKGIISIRKGGHGLFTDDKRPYEVWYPDQSEPSGYQTADEIWKYLKDNG